MVLFEVGGHSGLQNLDSLSADMIGGQFEGIDASDPK